MKKTLAILLAAVMLLAMSAVAMAATPTGNITVNNLEQWSKVELYQLIEMPFDDANNQYNDVKWTDEMATWLAGSSYSTLKPTDAPSSASPDDDAPQLYQDLYAAIKNGAAALPIVKNGQALTENATVSFSDLKVGTYMVIVYGGAKEHQPYVVSLKPEFVNHAWSVEDKTVDASKKATEPTIEKTVNKPTVGITEDVTFTIKTSVPKYAENAQEIKYWISDEMDEGLTYLAETLVVKGDSTVLTKDDAYTVEAFAGTASAGKKGLFKLVFDYDKIKDYNFITVTYDAKANEKIRVQALDNENKAIFEYTNGSKDDKACVYTFGIQITKTNKDNEKLEGAEFVLKLNGTELKFTKNINGIYKRDESGDTKLVSDANGLIKIDGLDVGTYTLVETKAPENYNPLKAPKTIELVQDGTSKNLLSGKTTAIYEETVVNSKGMIVPSTGGMGTTVFMVAGIVIMACAVVTLMMLLKRQKNGSEG